MAENIGVRSKVIFLASRSPRRRQLLRQIGLEFEGRENTVQEILDPEKSPRENVLSLSREKAREVSKGISRGIVSGFDTIVVLDGLMLGKPLDEVDATRMLRLLSGKEHRVYTGFTLVEMPGGREYSDCEMTTVRFRKLEDQEIRDYVASGSPMDKAGAYGIQDDMGAVFVERIEGCFYNVVGLPLTRFYIALRQFLREGHG